jgi:hypothetical protein
MKVIARNNGPYSENYDGSKSRKGLIKGKSYDVIEWAYRNQNGHSFIKRTDDFINPKEYKFYIKVINEDGIPHDYWNDYFLSSQELRDAKIDEILLEEGTSRVSLESEIK